MEKSGFGTRLFIGIIVLLGAVAFFYFVWPTSWEYTRKAPDVWRVNRFTGVREAASGEGWISEAEWKRLQDEKEKAKKTEAAEDQVEKLLAGADIPVDVKLIIKDESKLFDADLVLDYVKTNIELARSEEGAALIRKRAR